MKRGFTLIEVLIGISIFAIVATSVYTSLYLGINVWRRQSVFGERFQAAEVALADVARSLRSAFLNPLNEQIDFRGTNDSVAFFCISPEGDVEQVRYYCVADRQPGTVSLHCTRMTYARGNAHDTETETPSRDIIVSAELESVAFSYFNRKERTWQQEWKPQNAVPDMVKCEIVFFESSNRPATRCERYVALPLMYTHARGTADETREN